MTPPRQEDAATVLVTALHREARHELSAAAKVPDMPIATSREDQRRMYDAIEVWSAVDLAFEHWAKTGRAESDALWLSKKLAIMAGAVPYLPMSAERVLELSGLVAATCAAGAGEIVVHAANEARRSGAYRRVWQPLLSVAGSHTRREGLVQVLGVLTQSYRTGAADDLAAAEYIARVIDKVRAYEEG